MPDPERPQPRPARTAAPDARAARAAASGATTHAAHGLRRGWSAWQRLSGEYRLAAVAATGLFLSMFLPWYEQTTTAVVAGKLTTDSSSLTAFQAFSWIEAAVLVVAVAVLCLCFTRGEQRSYHLPGGDGSVLTAGGIWVAVLVFIRFIDKADVQATAVGVTWGIFITLLFGFLMAYSGLRLRAAHRPEPGPLDEAMATGRAPRERPRRPQPAAPDWPGRDDDATLTMLPDEEPTRLDRSDEAQTRLAPGDEEPTHIAPAPRPPSGTDPGEQLRFDD